MNAPRIRGERETDVDRVRAVNVRAFPTAAEAALVDVMPSSRPQNS